MTISFANIGERSADVPTMAPLQVLLHGSVSAPSQVDLVPNPDGLRAASFEDRSHETTVPRFGSQELVSLAAEATQLGFALRRFELLGDRNSPLLDEALVEEAGDALVRAFNASGAREVLRLLSYEFASVVVAGIVLFNPRMGQLTIRRGGVVIARDTPSARALLSIHWQIEHDG